MKKITSFIAILMAFTIMPSCKKDQGKLPNIAFITGNGYTSTDVTVAVGTVLKVGITASKAEDKDVLTTFDITRAYDSSAATSYYNETLTGTNGDTYTKDITITTRNVSGIEKYVFTVVNRDGLKNTVSLRIMTF